jgi:glucose-6-phosphate isomerase
MYPGTVGHEYFMTKGHYHEDPATAEIYYTISGRGMLLAETTDKRHIALEMKKGSIIHVEPGWAHRTYNTGSEPLVFLAIYPATAGHDYKTIEQEGFEHTVVQEADGPVVIRKANLL